MRQGEVEVGGGEWVHLKGENGMAVFVVGSKKPLGRVRWTIPLI